MAFRRDKALAAAERYAARGQHDKAAKEYQAVVENDPKDIRSWLLLADCLVRSGQPDEAIERYVQVAKFYQQGRDYQKALAVYRQVLNLDTSRLDVQLKCADLMKELGRMPDAIALWERVAQTYLRNGNADEALRIYTQVADLDPSQVARRLRVAELHSRQGNIDEAVAAFEACADFLYEAERFEEYVRVA